MVLTGGAEKGRSLEAPIRNALIIMPSILAIVSLMFYYPLITIVFYSDIKTAKGYEGLAPERSFTIAFTTMPESAPLHT